MSATAHLVVLMSPAEKATLRAEANADSTSAAESVHRAVAACDTDAVREEAVPHDLLDTFHASRAETLRGLDAAERAL